MHVQQVLNSSKRMIDLLYIIQEVDTSQAWKEDCNGAGSATPRVLDDCAVNGT